MKIMTIDKELLRELKTKMHAGPETADPDDSLKAFELLKQMAEDIEEIKEILSDMDIKVQIVVDDVNKEYWLTVDSGGIKYGEGRLESPSIEIFTSMEVAIGMLYGNFDPVSAYMSGEIVIEGDLPAAIDFQDVIAIAIEYFEDMTSDL